MKRIVGSGFSLIGVAGIALLALIALDVQGPHSPLAAVRLLLGLAFGLSIAAVPPIALILDKLPAIAAAMRSVLEDPDLAADLRQRGLERARQFTWERTARETLAVYQEVYERQPTIDR